MEFKLGKNVLTPYQYVNKDTYKKHRQKKFFKFLGVSVSNPS